MGAESGARLDREPVPAKPGTVDGSDDQHDQSGLSQRILAAGNRGRRRRREGHVDQRPLRDVVWIRSRAQGQHQPAATGAGPRGAATSGSESRRRAARGVHGHVHVPRAQRHRHATHRTRHRAARGLHAGESDGQHVGVSRDRRRRQHAAGQPQSRGRMGSVRLRRSQPPGPDRDRESRRTPRRYGCATGRRARSSPRCRADRSRRA